MDSGELARFAKCLRALTLPLDSPDAGEDNPAFTVCMTGGGTGEGRKLLPEIPLLS